MADQSPSRHETSAVTSQEPRLTFVEAVATPAAPMVKRTTRLRVHLAQGTQLEISDEQGAILAARLLRALELTHGTGHPC